MHARVRVLVRCVGVGCVGGLWVGGGDTAVCTCSWRCFGSHGRQQTGVNAARGSSRPAPPAAGCESNVAAAERNACSHRLSDAFRGPSDTGNVQENVRKTSGQRRWIQGWKLHVAQVLDQETKSCRTRWWKRSARLPPETTPCDACVATTARTPRNTTARMTPLCVLAQSHSPVPCTAEAPARTRCSPHHNGNTAVAGASRRGLTGQDSNRRRWWHRHGRRWHGFQGRRRRRTHVQSRLRCRCRQRRWWLR